MKEKGVLSTSFLGSAFETMNVTTRFYTASNTLFDDNMDDDSNVHNWKIEVNKLQALDNLAVLLPTLESMEERKYD